MLTTDQISQFKRDGYLIVENIIKADLLEKLQADYNTRLDELHSSWVRQGLAPEPKGKLTFWDKLDIARAHNIEWFQPLDISLPHDDIMEDTPYYFSNSVFDLITYDPLLDIAEGLLGGELTSTPIQHVRIKPPQHEIPDGEVRAHISSTAWHQDRGVGLAEADQTDMITVWVAVTDATLDNGCLQLIPNPPSDLYPHCPKSQTTIADAFIDEDRAIAAEMKAGSVILIHPLTPHCAGPNTSNGYRWSFDIRYNISGQPTGRSQFPDFVARSRNDPSLELRDPNSWRASWDAARKKLAHSEHIPQHRWSHDSINCA